MPCPFSLSSFTETSQQFANLSKSNHVYDWQQIINVYMIPLFVAKYNRSLCFFCKWDKGHVSPQVTAVNRWRTESYTNRMSRLDTVSASMTFHRGNPYVKSTLWVVATDNANTIMIRQKNNNIMLIPGPRLNIKTVLSAYGDFHVKDKTAVRTSYL